MKISVPNERYDELNPVEFHDRCLELSKNSFIPRILFGSDEREIGKGFVLYAVFSHPDTDSLEVPFISFSKGEKSFQSLTPDIPAFHWYEREIMDMFGIIPDGHPDTRSLVLHDCYNKGIAPLRRDIAVGEIKKNINNKRVDKYPFMKIDGEGVYEIPVGPVHAGIIEPGHFRFSAVGETVYFLDPRLFYVHKGIEKHFETLGFHEGVALAECVSGVSTVAHAAAYCRAVERMAGVDIPERAVTGRTVLLELERLYNHVGDIANMCAGTGFAVGYARGVTLREELQELNERITGSRFLRRALTLGGLSVDICKSSGDIIETVRDIGSRFKSYMKFLFSAVDHIDRLEKTGILSKEIALILGGTGPAARASGIKDDLRTAHPYLAYGGRIKHEPVIRTTGDVLARLNVRAEEVYEAVHFIELLLSETNEGELATVITDVPSEAMALGYTEGPRGAIFYFVKTDKTGRPMRVKVRSASYCNWPLIPFAVHGNIVPDFPLINKSFNLSYSGCDM